MRAQHPLLLLLLLLLHCALASVADPKPVNTFAPLSRPPVPISKRNEPTITGKARQNYCKTCTRRDSTQLSALESSSWRQLAMTLDFSNHPSACVHDPEFTSDPCRFGYEYANVTCFLVTCDCDKLCGYTISVLVLSPDVGVNWPAPRAFPFDLLQTFPNLQALSLSGAALYGELPSFTSWPSLNAMDLSFTQLAGSLSPLSTTMPFMYEFAAANTLLGTTLPEEGLASFMQVLDLSNNQLTGTIPDNFNQTQFEYLYLGNNSLVGNLPTLDVVHVLDVHANMLGGPIPAVCDPTSGSQLACWLPDQVSPPGGWACDGTFLHMRQYMLSQNSSTPLQCLCPQVLPDGISPSDCVPNLGTPAPVTFSDAMLVGQCEQVLAYPSSASDRHVRNPQTGFAPPFRVSSQIDGVSFTLTSPTAIAGRNGGGTSQTQVGLFLSRNDLPIMVLDVRANANGTISATLYACFVGAGLQYVRASAAWNYSLNGTVNMFLAWKRASSPEISAGVVAERVVVQVQVDPAQRTQWELSLLATEWVAVGVDVDVTRLRVINAPLPLGFSSSAASPVAAAPPSTGLLRRRLRRRLRPRQLAQAAPVSLSLELTVPTPTPTVPTLPWPSASPTRSAPTQSPPTAGTQSPHTAATQIFGTCTLRNTQRACNFGPLGTWAYTSASLHMSNLTGCADVKALRPFGSKLVQTDYWCPMAGGLVNNRTYSTLSKRTRLLWGLCTCVVTAAPVNSPLAQPSTVPTAQPSSVPSTMPTSSPTTAPTPLPQPKALTVCGSVNSALGPYACNPFACYNDSVRCVSDHFSGASCGAQQDLQRCARAGDGLVACPLGYFTCQDSSCSPGELGGGACDARRGVRFSPDLCREPDAPSPGPVGHAPSASPRPAGPPAAPGGAGLSQGAVAAIATVVTVAALALLAGTSYFGCCAALCLLGVGRQRRRDQQKLPQDLEEFGSKAGGGAAAFAGGSANEYSTLMRHDSLASKKSSMSPRPITPLTPRQDSSSLGGTPLSPAHDMDINIDELEIGELIGAGGNGRIFKALYNGTPVAVKELFSVMRGPSTSHPDAFSREFEALRILRHPHILQLFGACLVPSRDALGISRHLIVTELARESLADRLARVKDEIPLQEAERMALDIASGGAYIHALGMIHFDLKPANVLIDFSGTLKICDLGIAKFVRQRDDNSTTTAMTSTAVAQGTPMYMAPELLAGDDASQITKKVDVFAFSIICWEMMHRASPYPQTWSVLTLFRRVEAGDRPPLDDGRCPQGSHMRRVIEQSWAGSPHERPNFKALIEILKTRGATGRTLDVKPVAGHWVASTNTTQPLLPSLLVTQAPEYPALHSIVTVLMTRADGMAEHCRGEVLEVNEAEGCVSVQLLPEPSADELLLNPMAEEDEASTVFNPLADGLESKTSGWSRMSITGPPQVVSVRPAQIIKPDQTLSGLAIAHVRRQVQASRSVLGGNQISLPGTQAPQGLRLVIDTGEPDAPSAMSLLEPAGVLALGRTQRTPFKRSAAADEDDRDLLVGQTFDTHSLVLIRTCGAGECGVVWKAVHLPSLRIVAVKKVQVDDERKRAQIVNELAVLRANASSTGPGEDVPVQHDATNRLSRLMQGVAGRVRSLGSQENAGASPRKPDFLCPHIVKFYHVFLQDATLSVVMEYMEGGSLADAMRYGGCTDSTTLANVAHDLFNALAFLHSNNIIHRDVKPANVLISRSGVAKLSDFGIVSDMDLKPSVLASTFVGTMSYMSPERLRGEPYSFAADVWGAGLTVAAFSLGRFPAPASACANIFAMLDFFDKHDALLDVADANLAMFLRPTLSLNPAKRPTANECLAAPICARVGRRVRFEAAPKSAESRLLHYHSAGELSGSSTMESDLPMPPPLPLSSEDRAVRLQIIAERVVEKLLTDWCERGAAGQGQKQHAEISLSFKAMERLAEHLGVPVEHVVAVFKMQVEELDRAVKLKFSIKEDLRE